jgi:hypothetical protein
VLYLLDDKYNTFLLFSTPVFYFAILFRVWQVLLCVWMERVLPGQGKKAKKFGISNF